MTLARWKCPNCGVGKLAPSRARLDDTRRYCLPCSEATGRLVERICPVREKKAQERQTVLARRRAVEREEKVQELLTYPASLTVEFERFKRLKAWEADLSHCTLELRVARPRPFRRFVDGAITRGADPAKFWTSGRAFSSGRIVITAGTDPADARSVLLHELAHQAVWKRLQHNYESRGRRRVHHALFASFYRDAAEELLGVKITERYWYTRGRGVEKAVVEAIRQRMIEVNRIAAFLTGGGES